MVKQSMNAIDATIANPAYRGTPDSFLLCGLLLTRLILLIQKVVLPRFKQSINVLL